MGLFGLKKKLMDRQKQHLQKKLYKESQLASRREDIAELRKRIEHHKGRGADKGGMMPKLSPDTKKSMKRAGKGMAGFFHNAGKVSLVEPMKPKKAKDLEKKNLDMYY